MKENIGLTSIALFTLLPVVVWLFSAPFLVNFTSLGKVFGLMGMALFSINIILSARWRFLERVFRGQNQVYLKHHIIGGIALILLLFHPIFLTLNYSPNRAIKLILGQSQSGVIWGTLALFLMMILLVLTFYLRPRYDLWKFTHKFLGAAYFFAVLHTQLISSDISINIFLKIYYLVVSILALISFVSHSLLSRYVVKRLRYQVVRIKELTSDIIEISLKPTIDKLVFDPGQFIYISFLDETIGKEQHPFSIASPPSGDAIQLVIRKRGDYTVNLSKLKTGTKALIEGPYGRFSYVFSRLNHQIWIAGGIGITPFLSMIRELGKNSQKFSITLFYSAKDQDKAVYLPELKTYKSLAFHLVPTFTSVGKRLSIFDIESSLGLNGKEFFICGPTEMMTSLKKDLIKKGVKSDLIHTEEFDL